MREHPIIFLRGFAAAKSDVETGNSDPHTGFNLGSTLWRREATFDKTSGRYVSDENQYVFESVVLRLMKDHGYVDAYVNGRIPTKPASIPRRSIWVCPYYEIGKEEMMDFAIRLRQTILDVRNAVIGPNGDLSDFRVHLVAHSMGGLVCRTYLQNLCVHGKDGLNAALELEENLLGQPNDNIHLVDRVFTYGSPHNGIDIFRANVPRGLLFDPIDYGNFNRENMREYLKITDDTQDANSLDGAFPPERMFCLIGSDHENYDTFYTISRRVTGRSGDGLVLIKNAATKGSPRAIIHKAHGGSFGMVRSEEGYQNLRRFLFGEHRVDAFLEVDEVAHPKEVQKFIDMEGEDKVSGAFHVDSTVRVRKERTLLHDRRAGHESAAIYDHFGIEGRQGRPVYLFSGFLLKAEGEVTRTRSEMAFSIHVSVRVPDYKGDRLFLDHHFEDAEMLHEEVRLYLLSKNDGESEIKYSLRTVGHHRRFKLSADNDGRFRVPVGFREGLTLPPRPGMRCRLAFKVISFEDEE